MTTRDAPPAARTRRLAGCSRRFFLLALLLVGASGSAWAQIVPIRGKSLTLRDDSSAPINLQARRIIFRSSAYQDQPSGIVLPPPQSNGDPTASCAGGGGATLTVYNTAGTGESVSVALPAKNWQAQITSAGELKRYRYRDSRREDGPISSVSVDAKGGLRLKGKGPGWPYTLDEPSQGSIAVRLQLGSGATWCAQFAAKATGNPPSTASHDRIDKFVGAPNSPPPATCPALPEPRGCTRNGETWTCQYRTIAGVDPNLLSLDIYGAGVPNAPFMVYVHGGAWVTGDKGSQIDTKRAYFAAHGYVFVSVNYRLSQDPSTYPPIDPNRVIYPEHEQDVAAAVGFLKTHAATFGGDPTRISLMGHSAGAAIVALLATDESFLAAEGVALADDIDCAIPLDIGGAYDLDWLADSTQDESLWWNAYGPPNAPPTAAEREAYRATWRTASPIRQIGQGETLPSLFIVTNDSDVSRGGAQSAAFRDSILNLTNSHAELVVTGHYVSSTWVEDLTHAEINDAIGDPGDTYIMPALEPFLGTYCGTVAAAQRFSLADTIDVPGGEPESSAVLDLTDDGRMDLLIAANDIVYSAIQQGAPGVIDLGPVNTWNSDGNPIKGFGLHDFDRDGRLDPFLTRGGGITGSGETGLNLGTGDLTFTNLGNDVLVNSRTALFDDFDGDGRVDSLNLGSAFRENHAWNELHAGVAGGGFDPANSIDAAMPGPFWHQTVSLPGTPCDGEEWSNQQTKAGVIRDFDGDGKPDVMLVAYADLGFPDTRCPTEHQTFTATQGYRGVFLFRNESTPGTIRFADVSMAALGPTAYCNTLDGCDQYYTPVPFDMDRDGDLDVVLGGLVPPVTADGALFRLFRNDSTPGTIAFTDVTSASGAFQTFNALSPSDKRDFRFAEGVALDVDVDGLLDLAFVNRQDNGVDDGFGFVHVFRNLGSGQFTLLDRSVSGIPQYANAMSPGDFDGDGDGDLVVNDKAFTGKTYIYRNNASDTAHMVALEVKDQSTMSWLIGAKVFVYEPGGQLVAMDEVRTDFSYRSKQTPVIRATVPGAATVNVRVVDRAGIAHCYQDLATGTTHVLLVD